jgi:cell division protein FtsL
LKKLEKPAVLIKGSLHINLYYKILMIITFILAVFFIGFSIYNASEIFNIKKFKYADCDEDTVKANHKNLNDFNKEYINDLIYSIKRNRNLNNSKGTILLKSNRYFATGIYTLIFLIIELLIGIFVI